LGYFSKEKKEKAEDRADGVQTLPAPGKKCGARLCAPHGFY
jgi:hypothetical protein